MSSKEQHWERIQDLLDERRDPFDDEKVSAWLLDHPEELDAVVRLRTALAVIERSPRPVSRWRSIGLPIAAGIAGLLVLWRFSVNGTPRDDLPSMTAADTARPAPESRIIEFRLTVVTESSRRRVTTVFDGETLSRQVDSLPGGGADVSPLLASTTLSTLTSRRCER